MTATLTAGSSKQGETRDADAADDVSLALVQGALAHGAHTWKAERQRRTSRCSAEGRER